MNIQTLKGHIPDAVLNQLPDTIAKFNINTSLRLAHFLSQCAHESGNFTITKENLNYSAERLLVIFPKYFTQATAKGYEHNPEKIANRVYASRMGNGNELSGDGYKYCGRGYIQLTGHDNYAAFDKVVDEDILSTPTLVASKYPLMSAAWFFDSRGLWNICDEGSTVDAITHLTRHINGGVLGLKERIKYFNKFYTILK